jgi:hypothetical protein
MWQAVRSKLARLVSSFFCPAIGAEISIAIHTEEHSDVLELADFTWWVRQIGLESFLWKRSLVIICVTRFISRQGPGRRVLHLVQVSFRRV